MLRRLCITVQRRAIALTYYFEAAGIRRPGGVMVSVFYVCCLCCLLRCAQIDSWLKFRDYDRVLLVCRFLHRWLMGLKHISYVGFSIENKMADYLNNF